MGRVINLPMSIAGEHYMWEKNASPSPNIFAQADQDLSRLMNVAAADAAAEERAQKRDSDVRLSYKGFVAAVLKHAHHGQDVLVEIRRRMAEAPLMWDVTRTYIGQVSDMVVAREFRSPAREGWVPTPYALFQRMGEIQQQAQQVESANVWSLVVLALENVHDRHPEVFGQIDDPEKLAFEGEARKQRAADSLSVLARVPLRYLVGAAVSLGLSPDPRDPVVLAQRLRDHVGKFGETPAPPSRVRTEYGAFLR